MGKIGGQTLERKRGISRREELLVGKVVVQAQKIIEVHVPNANAFAKLNRCGLAGQARSSRFGVEGSDRRTRLARSRAKANKAAVDFAVKAGIQPLVEWLHRASAHDGLSHSVEGAACRSRSRTQTKVGEL